METPVKPPKKRVHGWTKAKIKYQLASCGVESLRSLDIERGLPIGTMSNTLCRPDPRGETVIAEIIGVAPHIIWPDRYDADGQRLKPQPGHQIRAEVEARHRQKQAAA